MRGVSRVLVGYAGGVEQDPTYRNIQDYTESLWIEFNPKQVSYWQVLEMWHDNDSPWRPEEQQYRSAIFYTSLAQQQEAQNFLQHLRTIEAKRHLGHLGSRGQRPERQLYVDLEEAMNFYQAEDYHQDYISKRQQQQRTSNPKTLAHILE